MFPDFSETLPVWTESEGHQVAQTQGQRRASQAVVAWLAHEERNTAWLARVTGADPGTIGDFLNGNRWPKYGTQGKIEKKIGWPPGTLTAVADGAEPPAIGTVGGDAEDEAVEEIDELLYRRPEGMGDAEWEQVKRESREYIEWQIERASKER